MTRAEQTASRCDAFRARVEEHLKTLPDDYARRRFLEAQLDTFEDSYREFQRLNAIGRYRGDATAAQYAITIADLGALKSRYTKEAALADA